MLCQPYTIENGKLTIDVEINCEQLISLIVFIIVMPSFNCMFYRLYRL